MLPKILRVHGHSMQPAIQDEKKVLLVPYLFFKPKMSDIVAARINGKIFIKRIKSISDRRYFLTGDNQNDSLDSRKLGLVTRKDILGKVLFT